MTAHKQKPNFGFDPISDEEKKRVISDQLSSIVANNDDEIRMVFEFLRASGFKTFRDEGISWAIEQGVKGFRRYHAEKLWHNARSNLGAIEELLTLQAEAKQRDQRFKPLAAAMLEALHGPKWRIKGVFPAEGMAAMYGASASGKSFAALDMAAAIAEGRPFFGHATKATSVLVVSLGEGGYPARVEAWKRHHGCDMPDGVRFLLTPFRLTNAQDVAELAAICPQGCVVFIDTLNRAAPGMDENSSRDMGMAIEGAKNLQRLIGGLVVLIAHTGKDATKGLRGHSSLFAALDVAILVSRDFESRSWTVDKAKDGKDGISHRFKLEVVSLGADEDGDEITSCVVVRDESPTLSARNRPLSANQQLGIYTFNEGIKNLDGVEGGGVFDGLHVELWREEFYRRCPADSDAAKRKAFHRARTDLTASGFLIVEDDVYRLGSSSAGFVASRLAQGLRGKA